MFEVNDLFYANLNAKEKCIVNQGGTSSAKTYSIMQALSYIALQEKQLVITVTGESIPNLKKGAYRDFETIVSSSNYLQTRIANWNKSDRTIVFDNGSLIEFISNQTEQGAKNGKRDYLFVNEANGVSWPIFYQMAMRTRKKIFIDYNPSAPFWAHEQLIGTDPTTNELTCTVRLIISDHRRNRFLSDEQHRQIEGIKDPELWKVYARGLTGNLSGLIYPNWRKIPDDQFPNDVPFIGGLDFGYTNDPTAGVKVARIGDNIFLHEIFYETGLAPLRQKQLFYANGFHDDSVIYAEHDPDSISQLRALRLRVMPARKGPGSINAGIQFMKQFNVFYTASSFNLDIERSKYMWMKDPATGKPINTPIDQFNHLLDAARYPVYTYWGRHGEAA